MQENKMANPAALGLGGFALTTFLLSMVNAKIIVPESIGMVVPMGLSYGGLAQLLAGMWEFKSRNTFGATCFSSFGAFWIGLAMMVLLEGAGVIAAVPPAGLAVFHCLGYTYLLCNRSLFQNIKGTGKHLCAADDYVLPAGSW